MLKVGITGGIGSGKTTVCRYFEELGIPVYYADERAKYLMQHEHYLIDEIQRNFGKDIYEGGQLNRQLLAEMVFNNKQKLDLLNSLVHPAVFRDNERWTEGQLAKKVPYIIKEAALLIESGSSKSLDKLIVVSAPLNVRVERISKRDNLQTEDIMARVRNQMPEEEKLKQADFVITNDGGMDSLKEQVLNIHQKLTGEKYSL